MARENTAEWMTFEKKEWKVWERWSWEHGRKMCSGPMYGGHGGFSRRRESKKSQSKARGEMKEEKKGDCTWVYKQQDCIWLWLASPWRIFSSNVMWSDLHFKKTIWQTKWIAGKARIKVGRPASKAISVTQTGHAGGGNGGGEKESESRCRLVTVTWHNFLTDNSGCEEKGD